MINQILLSGSVFVLANHEKCGGVDLTWSRVPGLILGIVLGLVFILVMYKLWKRVYLATIINIVAAFLLFYLFWHYALYNYFFPDIVFAGFMLSALPSGLAVLFRYWDVEDAKA